jgi:hypothetical protein
MAKLTDYPRWRYHAMQACMWVLFVCSLGVAALVDWDIRRSGASELSQEVELESVTLRVPKTWRVGEVMGSGSSATVTVVEPIRTMKARRIIISEDPDASASSSEIARRRSRREQPIRFGEGGTGSMSVALTELPDMLGIDAAQLHVAAHGNLGSGSTITIVLDALQTDGRPSAEQSVDLVKRIAASARPLLSEKGPSIGPG